MAQKRSSTAGERPIPDEPLFQPFHALLQTAAIMNREPVRFPSAKHGRQQNKSRK
jgi:hypothetical protein